MNVDPDGYFFFIPALTASAPIWLPWVFGGAIAISSALVIDAAGLNPFSFFAKAGHGITEHVKGARKSTKKKHENGQKRKSTDQGGEKGDARRTPRTDKKKR